MQNTVKELPCNTAHAAGGGGGGAFASTGTGFAPLGSASGELLLVGNVFVKRFRRRFKGRAPLRWLAY